MPSDPTPNEGAGTALSRPGPTSADGSGSDAGTVSLSEHQRAIDEERKRRAGQEREHRRQMEALQAKLDALESRLASGSTQGASQPNATQQAILERLRSPDPAVQRQAIEEGLLAMHSWTEHFSQQQQSAKERQRLQQAIDEAVEEEMSNGVPRDALNTTSPDAVHRSAERWTEQQRIKALEDQIAALSKERVTVDQAVTQTRAALGATTVSTSTGRPPAVPTEVEEEVQRLQGLIADAKRRHDGASVTALMRQLRQVMSRAA